jgi:hypothetical protein
LLPPFINVAGDGIGASASAVLDQNGKLQTIQPLISVVSSNQTFLKFNLTSFKSGTYFIINDDGVAIEKYMYRRPRSNAIISRLVV